MNTIEQLTEWMPINGYGEKYLVNRLGEIKSNSIKSNGRILKPYTNPYGYCVVNLHINGVAKITRVHRAVAEAFLPNTENKPEVNHINGIKTDNRAENLEWATPKENVKHGWSTGLNKGNTNKIFSEDHRMKISKANAGKKRSAEEVENMRQRAIAWWSNKKQNIA